MGMTLSTALDLPPTSRNAWSIAPDLPHAQPPNPMVSRPPDDSDDFSPTSAVSQRLGGRVASLDNSSSRAPLFLSSTSSASTSTPSPEGVHSSFFSTPRSTLCPRRNSPGRDVFLSEEIQDGRLPSRPCARDIVRGWLREISRFPLPILIYSRAGRFMIPRLPPFFYDLGPALSSCLRETSTHSGCLRRAAEMRCPFPSYWCPSEVLAKVRLRRWAPPCRLRRYARSGRRFDQNRHPVCRTVDVVVGGWAFFGSDDHAFVLRPKYLSCHPPLAESACADVSTARRVILDLGRRWDFPRLWVVRRVFAAWSCRSPLPHAAFRRAPILRSTISPFLLWRAGLLYR